ITAPVLLAFEGVDAIWLGVMFGVNLQTGFLTPPFGFSLFYLRGVAPRSVSTGAIYRGIIPFVALQLVALWLLWEVPSLATWLPRWVYAEGPALEGTIDLIEEEGDESLIPEQEEQPLDPEAEDLVPDQEDAADDLIPAEEGEDLIPPAEGETGAEETGVDEPADDLIPPAEQ
ncbi:MAG TPA: TRAP transporter large permease subunit, partial [Alphaproteobacteria bacterium]